MSSFVDSCLNSLTDSTVKVEKRQHVRRRVGYLLRALAGKKRILITSHLHPDPDAIASCQAMQTLLASLMPEATMTVRLKGQVGGGINSAFTRIADLKQEPWSDAALPEYDAIILVDTQPAFSNSPLPPEFPPTVVIDHHRGRGRRARYPHLDVRTDVGATASILFSYFMERNIPIPAPLAATLLYAIESDLAGAAGQQGGLDTIAISSLTLLADTRRLYQMRYVDLPRLYYGAFARTVEAATTFGPAVVSHLGKVEFAEVPGVMADFLLRCEGINWAMVTAMHEGRFVFSLRTQNTNKSAGEVAYRISKEIGDGGGHFTKAGGVIRLPCECAADEQRVHTRLRRRLLRCLHVPLTRGSKLDTR